MLKERSAGTRQGGFWGIARITRMRPSPIRGKAYEPSACVNIARSPPAPAIVIATPGTPCPVAAFVTRPWTPPISVEGLGVRLKLTVVVSPDWAATFLTAASLRLDHA